MPWLVALAGAGVTAIAAESVAAHYRYGPVDDAFISLRYAANWATGRGLCFNPGEFVEGYTNFFLVLIEAGAIRCGAHPVLAMSLVGRASLACLGGLLAAFVFVHVFPGAVLTAITAGALSALNAVLICWSFSGMETTLLALLLVAAMMAVLAAKATPGAILAAGCLVLAAMTRPDAVVFVPAAAVVLYLRRRSIGPVVWLVAVFVVVFGGYYAARAIHFGYLFPNTFYAKLDYGNTWLAQRGALYVWDFVRASPVLFALVVASLALVRRASHWVKACLLAVGTYLSAIIYMGGDHFAMFRFMAPIVPFVALAALYPAVALIARYRLSRWRSMAPVALSLIGLGASDLLVGRQSKRGEVPPMTHHERFLLECKCARRWENMGRWFKLNAPPEASLATIAVGAIGYFSDLKIIDPHGIVNPAIAHLGRELGRGDAGHEKYDIQQLLSQRPSYILLVNFLTKAPVPSEALPGVLWGEFSKALARDPHLYEQYRHRAIRLGDHYLNVFVRRGLPAPGLPTSAFHSSGLAG